MTDPAARPIPEGYEPLDLSAIHFLHVNGPFYGRRSGEYFQLGFRVERRHCNPSDVCHGGMLMSFVDIQVPLGARMQGNRDLGFMPTISLTADFLRPAPLGAWVEGRTDCLRTTRNLVFAQALITADGEPVLRASGIFKVTTNQDGLNPVRHLLEK